MKHWRTILAALACLALLGAGLALAGEKEKTIEITNYDDDGEHKQLRVEVVEEDGTARVKVWEIEDGEETLVKEYEADAAEGERVIELDDGHICIIKGDDDEKCRIKFFDGEAFFDDDLEDAFVFAGDDDVFSWVSADDGAYLGVQLSGMSDAQAEYFEVDDGEGALITEVVEDSPAEKAGFRIYDVILEIDGEEVGEPDDVVEAVRDHEEGDEVEVVVLRKGDRKTLKATLAEREGSAWAYAFDPVERHVLKRLHKPGKHAAPKLYHEFLTPRPPVDQDELDNLRADIEELRAMLEELKKELK
jgi:hypothetical protein